MPFRNDLLSISPTGKKDYQLFLKKISVLQSEYGFIWLDYQTSLSLTDEDFRDVDHLNTQGALKLSTNLGEYLAKFITSVGELPLSGDRK